MKFGSHFVGHLYFSKHLTSLFLQGVSEKILKTFTLYCHRVVEILKCLGEVWHISTSLLFFKLLLFYFTFFSILILWWNNTMQLSLVYICVCFNWISSFLLEQYDAFVKFNYDQVQRRFHETPPTCKHYISNLLSLWQQ